MEKKLPKGWVETTLGVVAKWGSGGTPSRGNSSYYGGNIPWIKTGDLNKGIITNASEFITEAGLKNSSAKLFPKGSIAIAMYGATIGKTAEFGIAAATNQACGVAQVYDGVERNFLHQYLKSEKQTFIDKGKGGAQPNISQTVLKAHPFPLPPLPEQKRIVTKLDGLFGHLEKLNSRLDRIPVLLKNFRQAVLTQAVTGKLTEEWRVGKELETKEYLNSIIDKRKKNYLSEVNDAKKLGERKPSKKFLHQLPEIEKIKIKLPDSWTQTNIHFLAFVTKLAGFEYTKHFKLNDDGEIPVIRAQNVQMGKFVDKNRLYLSKEKSDFLTRSQLHGREILMVFIGAGTGNVCLAPSDERWHLAPNVAKIDVDSINRKYLFYYLQSNLGVTNALSRVKATAQPSLSMATIREIIVLFPSIHEQKEIVRQVESLLKKADQIESKYKTLKAKIDQLPQAILAKAFKGELVEQLPTDGDARDLLEEIQKLKAEELSKGKGKGKKKKETGKKKGQGKLF